MKLALVIPSLGCGGAERVMTLLANGWAQRGSAPILITLASAETDFYALDPAVQRVELDLLKDSRNPLAALINNWRRVRALRKALRDHNADAVICFMTTTNILTALVCYGLKIPALLAERISPTNPLPGAIWRGLQQLIYARASLVVQTEQGAEWFRQRFPRSYVQVIPNPVVVTNDEAVDTATHRLLKSLPKTQFIVGMGRLVSQKGFDLLLRAFASIRPRHSEWSLVILGEGPEREKLTQLAQELDVWDYVYMPGRLTEPHTVLRRAALFALSSRYEGMPNALVEAMACGVPCVSFDCPTGPAELIGHGVNGLLVPPEDVPALARSMERLMGNSELRTRLGQAACGVQSRYHLDSVLAQWEDLLSYDIKSRKMKNNRKTKRAIVPRNTDLVPPEAE